MNLQRGRGVRVQIRDPLPTTCPLRCESPMVTCTIGFSLRYHQNCVPSDSSLSKMCLLNGTALAERQAISARGGSSG